MIPLLLQKKTVLIIILFIKKNNDYIAELIGALQYVQRKQCCRRVSGIHTVQGFSSHV